MLSTIDMIEIAALLALMVAVATWGDSLVGYAGDRITDWRERRTPRMSPARPKLAKPGDEALDLEAALFERGPLPDWEDTRQVA